MAQDLDPNVLPFEEDLAAHGGYLYTTDAPLSSRLANERLTQVSLELADPAGRRVLDLGCGDGAYTIELADRGRPAQLQGLDASPRAVAAARQRAGGRDVGFQEGDIYALPFAADDFDIAYMRGLLHHLDRPQEAIREALRVARQIVVLEPNGYNPGLKLLERCSRYHVEHGERSYAPRRLDRWVQSAGARVQRRQWVGFVPFFSPDWYARAAKRVEPLLERLPAARSVACAHYVFSALRV